MARLRFMYKLYLFIFVVLSSANIDAESMRSKRAMNKSRLPQDTYAIYSFNFQGNPSDMPGFIVPDPLRIPTVTELFSAFPYTVKISNTEFLGLSNLDIVYSEVDFMNFEFNAYMKVPKSTVLGNITIITDLLYTTSYWSSLYNITLIGTSMILRGNIVINEEGYLQLNKEDLLFEVAYEEASLKTENLPFWAETLVEDSADMFRSALQSMINEWVPDFLSQGIKTEFHMKFPDKEDVVNNIFVKPRISFSRLRSTHQFMKNIGVSKVLTCRDLTLKAENGLYRSRNYEMSYTDSMLRIVEQTEVDLLKVTGKCRLLFLKNINFEIQLHNYVSVSETLFHTQKLSPPTMRELKREIGNVVMTKPNLGSVSSSSSSYITDLPKKLWAAIQRNILRLEHWMDLDIQLNSLKINYVIGNRLFTKA